MPKHIKPIKTGKTVKTHAKAQKITSNRVITAPGKFKDMLAAVQTKGGEITVEYIKVDGTPRKQRGAVKPYVTPRDNGLSFHLTGDFDDKRNWRGCRADCIVRLAWLHGGKVYDCTVRDVKVAQRNAAAAMALRAAKHGAVRGALLTPTAKGDLF